MIWGQTELTNGRPCGRGLPRWTIKIATEVLRRTETIQAGSGDDANAIIDIRLCLKPVGRTLRAVPEAESDVTERSCSPNLPTGLEVDSTARLDTR